MKRLIQFILQRLSLRLGLLIIFTITVIFSLLFNILFDHTKQYVRQVAINRATLLLDNTVSRMNGIMNETEVITNYMAVTVPRHLHPDSLLVFTRRTIIEHPFLTGLAISMEPYYFPEMGRYFSAYSLNQDDTIITVREGPFEYFEKIWYKSPHDLGAPCWVDAYDDYNEGTLSSKDILTSYCCPMRDSNGQFVGSITTSLTLKWLSSALTTIQAYPNSSAIMIGRTGTYLVHPDTAKLFRQTIFSDAAPNVKDDINVLGKDMIAGRSGMMQTFVDGNKSYIFYRPLERTGWSIAIVCPESDVFRNYNQLVYTVWILIIIGLTLLLLLCYQTIRRGIHPLKQLARQVQRMTDGHFDDPLPRNDRYDSVGRLTNSFILMQQSLSESISTIRKVNNELEQRNQELTQAYQLKLESDQQKSAFIQNMSHQIRTPLNIICGFTQILAADIQERQGTKEGEILSDSEVTDITSRMKAASKTISHISRMLSTSSTLNSQQEPLLTTFSCNTLCRAVISPIISDVHDGVKIKVDTEVPDSLTIRTDMQILRTILDELLDNAIKFTKEGSITIGCRQTDEHTICFSVSDTGTGIPLSERNRIFTPFTKLNSFTEGIGLGLSLCYHAAHQLGGDLIYDETYTKGTRFIVSIPLHHSN